MATATSILASYDRPVSSSAKNFRLSDNETGSHENSHFFLTEPDAAAPRPGQYLDDSDVLMLKRQFDNMNLFEQNRLSNSAEDLSQLDRAPYGFDMFGQDEEDVPVDEDHGYDYDLVIRERLRKANEEFEHDQTPAELKRPQRVSFDTVVKAVDIVQPSRENDTADSSDGRSTLTTISESPPRAVNIDNATGKHEYTVPLNDIQPRQGPTLTEQLKALQFYGIPLPDKSWAALESQPALVHSSEHSVVDSDEDRRSSSSSAAPPRTSMVVSKNGCFDLQSRDDYTAQHSLPSSSHERSAPTPKAKASFVPKPPSEPKRDQAAAAPPRRRVQIRPNSSDSVRRTNPSQTRSFSFVRDPTETKDQQRPKSASVAVSNAERPMSGVDFDELQRKASEKKRAELREERRLKREADEKQQSDMARAKASFERWLEEKQAEDRRTLEEKRLKREENQIRKANEESKSAEQREKKYKQWVARKQRETMMTREFERLKAEDQLTSSGSPLSTHSGDHRAFHRWLRRKYEQSLEEKRQRRLESKRQRRLQRSSIKRCQLQHDIQLAKSFGYS